jgi:peroxiredoxin
MAGNIATPRAAGKRFDFALQLRDASRSQELILRRPNMTIKVGDKLPDGKLSESTEFDEAAGCPMPPKDVGVADALKGKKVVIFAIPGAYTPTCSAKHVPSYVKNYDKLKAKKVDEIWCVATNDAFVMAAWGRDQKTGGKIRMMGDGSVNWTKALGLELDLTARNMGVRSQRYSMLVENGVVKKLNVEAPGKYEVSGAEIMLSQL